MAAAQKRPELARVITTYAAHVPQIYVDVDREKVMRQQVALADVYQTLETFMGGYLVNYFNRFGRQWQVYLEAEGELPHQRRATSTSSMCATATGDGAAQRL